MSKATTTTDEQLRAAREQGDIDIARHEFTLDGLLVTAAEGVLCDVCALEFTHGIHLTARPRASAQTRLQREMEEEGALESALELVAEADESELEASDGTSEETRSQLRFGEFTYIRKTVQICTVHNIVYCRECRFAQQRWAQIQKQRRARRQWMKKPEQPFFVTSTYSQEVERSIRRPEEPWAYQNPVSLAKAREEREEERATVMVYRHDTRACAPVTKAIRAYLDRLAPQYIEVGTREVFEPRPSNARWQGYRPRILAS